MDNTDGDFSGTYSAVTASSEPDKIFVYVCGNVMSAEREKELLETVEQVIAEGPYKPEWGSLMKAEVPAWFKEQKLGIFMHWGLYSVPANSMSGISEICILRGCRHTSTISRPMVRRKNSVIRISFRCLPQKNLTRMSGWSCFRRQARAIFSRLQNIMTASRCTKVSFPDGTRQRWDQSGMCSET